MTFVFFIRIFIIKVDFFDTSKQNNFPCRDLVASRLVDTKISLLEIGNRFPLILRNIKDFDIRKVIVPIGDRINRIPAKNKDVLLIEYADAHALSPLLSWSNFQPFISFNRVDFTCVQRIWINLTIINNTDLRLVRDTSNNVDKVLDLDDAVVCSGIIHGLHVNKAVSVLVIEKGVS